jgi:uncharacterized membrane protein SpoIIM required for sporulation
MATKTERFMLEKQEKWARLATMVNLLKGNERLSLNQVKEFPNLYRQVCTDMAEAKSLELAPDILDYLNTLVGSAHKELYRVKALSRRKFASFFLHDLPFVLVRQWPYMLVSVLLFFGPFFVSWAVIAENGSLAKLIIPEQVLEMMEESYSQPIDTPRSQGIKTYMTSYYIQHNISIAFYSFAGGLIFGVGSIYFLIYNGIFLGAVFGYIFSLDFGRNIIGFTTAHAPFELIGIAIAGAAGLYLGVSVLSFHKLRNESALTERKNELLTFLASGALLIFFAAFIEGNISPSTLPYGVKLTVGISSLIFILSYFLFYPLILKLISRQKRSSDRKAGSL